MAEIRDGDGVLNTLIYGSADDVGGFEELVAAARTLNDVLGKIDEGQGTLGLLVNDPTLYEDMKVLLGGAQRSTLLRSMIRMAVEEGEAEP